MSFLATKNLVSTVVEPCVPWEYTPVYIPNEVRGKEGKTARDAWINDLGTDHQCYTAFEGTIANHRIKEPKGNEEGNPPLSMSAFVADFDCPSADAEFLAGIDRSSFKPNYFERTLSGNGRLIYLLEEPVRFPSYKFAKEFLKLALVRLRLDQVAPSLDRPAFEEPNRLYTNSGEWSVCNVEARIPKSLITGWVMEVAEKHLWKKERGALEIPLPVVWEALQKKYPKSADWQGEFVEGAQGPTFWVEGSESPKSAIVKTTGLFTFSAHAHKPFFSWQDVLGHEFVETYTTQLLGKAVEGIWHDGQSYWRQDGYGLWKRFSKEDIALHLATDKGLNTQKNQGLPSEVNRALSYIQSWQGIEGAAPFAFQRPGVMHYHGSRVLNTHTRRVMPPASEKQSWGPHGNFPFISFFFDHLFHEESEPKMPKEYYLAWAARFYSGAYHLEMQNGQSVFIMGAPGVGKSLLNQALLPMLMGGAAEAQGYLMGETNFNKALFDCALWTIDDNSIALDALSHRFWSAMIKKYAANTSHTFEAKFRDQTQVEWNGRISVTTNADAASAAIVPDLSISNLDKTSLYRTVDKAPMKFPTKQEIKRILERELPFFARWLLDYSCPEWLVGDNRFGTVPYHEKTLMETAEESSRTAAASDIIDLWRQDYFSENKTTEYWEGSVARLLLAMNRDESFSRALMKGMDAQRLSTHLSSLSAKGVSWLKIIQGSSGSRIWRILPSDTKPVETLPIGDKYNKQA